MYTDERIGEDDQHRDPLKASVDMLSNLITHHNNILTLFKLPECVTLPDVRCFAHADQALSDKASMFELFRIKIVLGIWINFNDVFMRWIGRHLMINDDIVKTMKAQTNRLHNVLQGTRILAMTKFLKRPCVDHTTGMMVGPALNFNKPVSKQYQRLLREMTSESKGEYRYYGSPEQLQEIYDNESPDTILSYIKLNAPFIYRYVESDSQGTRPISQRTDVSTNTDNNYLEINYPPSVSKGRKMLIPRIRKLKETCSPVHYSRVSEAKHGYYLRRTSVREYQAEAKRKKQAKLFNEKSEVEAEMAQAMKEMNDAMNEANAIADQLKALMCQLPQPK